MLSIAPPPTIFLPTAATDMRKSFDGLTGIIRNTFGSDPTDGSLFLFINKRRDRIKALWWNGDGFVLWYKRLEQGTFETVQPTGEEHPVRIDSTQLAMILGGVTLENKTRRKRYRLSLQ
jgi:transposase